MVVSDTVSSQRVEMFARASMLPPEWDTGCGTFLRRIRMLSHYEQYNPCNQRYYCHFRDGQLVAGCIVYSHTQNLLTFLGNIHSPISMNIVGIPASISPAGAWGALPEAAVLLDEIFRREKGLTLVLNLPVPFPGTRAHRCRLLPGMIFTNRFRSVAEYEQALRAPWRRRIKATQRKFEDVHNVRETCAAFTRKHHDLYLDVLARAPEKMETLDLDFFRELPPPVELVSCYRGRDLICWRLILVEQGRLLFLLGGHDYALNGRYDAYFNNLFGVLEDGITKGVLRIDLGQTAEDPKVRLGAKPMPEQMLLHHTNPIWRRLVGLAAPLLAYRKTMPVYHVFREGRAGS